ncbi:MAG TPA: DNA-processing protein DprA [Fimbriimonadaceae bacterium]|nr:DNA-processing protein DprA [Fimbriimonadaceae bacterium]
MSPRVLQAFLQAELQPIKSRTLWRELGSSGDEGVQLLRNHRTLSSTEQSRLESLDLDSLDKAVSSGIRPIGFSAYPETLRNWVDYPIGLFGWGDWSCANAPTVAIVGTRGASTYGKAVAMKFAEAFARAGITVVSGGAIGIDGAAHKGALAVGGKTIAVLAGGVDRWYPAIHRGLFQQTRESGCLISQFACGVKPNPYRFLQRNCLIAGLSRATVVIEAPERSGAIYTANRANEMGRHVFVVPANIENINFRGSHALIRDGAVLVDHPDLVMDALGVLPSETIEETSPISEIASKILSNLSTTPLAVEFILDRTGLPMSDVIGELTLLELEGRIIHDAGGYALKP